jgi:hypothetical protein
MMKILLFILLLSYHLFIYATEQTPDILVIGNDTIYLKSFPLDDLNFSHRPFGEELINTGCWRGYQAVWMIENDSLFLKEIRPCYPDTALVQFNIEKYFIDNEYNPVIIGGKIFADWYSAKFIHYYVSAFSHCYYSPSNDEVDYYNIVLWFQKGVLVLNRL